MRPSSLQRDVRSDGQTRLVKLSLRKLTCNNFHRVPMIPRQKKGQKMNKNVKFWHSLKVKPGFLIVLINLKTGATQWRAGVGRQRGTKVREAGERGRGNGRLGPPVPSTPPPPHKKPGLINLKTGAT